MRWCDKFSLFGVVVAAALMSAPAAGTQTLSQPDGWRTRAERFVAMPPGFHITTSSAVLFYHPDATAEGEFTVSSEGFLFRGESANTYGLFIGGRDLDNDGAAWTSLEIGHDGTWVVRERRDPGEGYRTVIADLAGPAAGPVRLPGDEVTAKNVLAIRVGQAEVTFLVNDEAVTRLPRQDVAVDGVVGFRVGSDLNLHLTTLTITEGDEVRQWAPARPDAPEGEGT